MEHEEYTAENYPTSGKKYNNEKAIISLTSWKARINTVSKTLFSLIKQCPGFHIVLVLSEEEFPQKEKELPDDLMVFVENELIELLWVYKNYRSFKKIFPVIDKYRNSYFLFTVDDDKYYQKTYWNLMIQKLGNNDSYCPFGCDVIGPCMIYSSTIFDETFKDNISNELIETCVDDTYISYYLKSKNAKIYFERNKEILDLISSHDEIEPLCNYYTKENRIKTAENICRKIYENNF